VRTELEPLYEMIDELEIAMMTTRRTDGHLEARAMATQRRAEGADLWFVAAEGSGKLREIEDDPRVGLSYYKDRTREWISVSGLARLSRDRETIRELYAEDWSIWFPDGDDPRHGTADDPRYVLIGVDVHAASFLRQDKPQPVVLFEIAKALVTDETPELGETTRIEPSEPARRD
jgi:general stress protein 26